LQNITSWQLFSSLQHFLPKWIYHKELHVFYIQLRRTSSVTYMKNKHTLCLTFKLKSCQYNFHNGHQNISSVVKICEGKNLNMSISILKTYSSDLKNQSVGCLLLCQHEHTLYSLFTRENKYKSKDTNLYIR